MTKEKSVSDSTNPDRVCDRFLNLVDLVLRVNKKYGVNPRSDSMLSEMVYNDPSWVWKLRRKQVSLTFERAFKLTVFFDLDVNYLFWGGEPISYNPAMMGVFTLSRDREVVFSNRFEYQKQVAEILSENYSWSVGSNWSGIGYWKKKVLPLCKQVSLVRREKILKYCRQVQRQMWHLQLNNRRKTRQIDYLIEEVNRLNEALDRLVSKRWDLQEETIEAIMKYLPGTSSSSIHST